MKVIVSSITLMKSAPAKNTGGGAILQTEIVGKNIGDPFFDSYEEDRFACYDIISLVDGCVGETVVIHFDKRFLRRLVHSHLCYIKYLEKEVDADRNSSARKD